jgi:hypothetical protein
VSVVSDAKRSGVTRDATYTSVRKVLFAFVVLIVANPGDTAVTTPLSSTVATPGFDDVHPCTGMRSGVVNDCRAIVFRCPGSIRAESGFVV